MPVNEALFVTLTMAFAALAIEAVLIVLRESDWTVLVISVLLSSESSAAPVVLAENDPN